MASGVGLCGVIVFPTLIGAAMNFLGINPSKGLYYMAVIDGIVAPPLLWMIMLISINRNIVKDKVNGRASNVLG